MRTLIVLTLFIGVIFGLPQFKGKSEEKSSDDSYEMLSYKVIETHEDYEVRKYAKSKWVCTSFMTNLADDPLKDWRSRFSSPFEAMNSAAWMDSKEYKAFMSLFKYIVGVNKGNVEIKMTRPVATHITPIQNGEYKSEMCFWTGTPWVGKDLPEPIDKKIYVQKKPEMMVYVRQFGGYAFSAEDWNSNRTKLAESLAEHTDVDLTTFYGVGYDSPYKIGNRRNEIWFKKMETQNVQRVANDDDDDDEESDTEKLPYEVLKESEDFELRKYGPSKWVCTEEKNVDTTNDIFQDWQSKYSTAMEAYQKTRKERKKRKQHFKMLYAYISGVNEDYTSIEMTSPVIKKRTLVDEENSLEDMQVCFWTGSEWQDKALPKPVKEGVSIVELPEMYVYARRFGGWALSHSDWDKEKEMLMESVGDHVYMKDHFYTASYNSPWKTENRRNEVWLQVEKNDVEAMMKEE